MVEGASAGAVLSTVVTPASRAVASAASMVCTGDSSCTSTTLAPVSSACWWCRKSVLSAALAPGPITMVLRPRAST
ncbi:hypothetical protein G6F52_014256 [Rhizopus delemar]|nr:hypothetical protein G6F52_014256 [Rhizopus delemar]